MLAQSLYNVTKSRFLSFTFVMSFVTPFSDLKSNLRIYSAGNYVRRYLDSNAGLACRVLSAKRTTQTYLEPCHTRLAVLGADKDSFHFYGYFSSKFYLVSGRTV